MFRRRARSGADIDPDLLRTDPVGLELALDRLLMSCAPVQSAPEGERDRREQAVLDQLRSVLAFADQPFDAEKWLADWRRGRDYQLDHPLGSVDRMLDEAFVPDQAYSRDSLTALTGLLDLLSIRRLGTYSVRCCSRALMTKRPELARAGLRARAWVVLATEDNGDARDDMVALAPFVVAGRAVSSDPNPLRLLIELTAGKAPFSELVESFGQRSDVTLRAFGYQLLSTDHGQWIVQA
jgi:hypothetical protein